MARRDGGSSWAGGKDKRESSQAFKPNLKWVELVGALSDAREKLRENVEAMLDMARAGCEGNGEDTRKWVDFDRARTDGETCLNYLRMGEPYLAVAFAVKANARLSVGSMSDADYAARVDAAMGDPKAHGPVVAEERKQAAWWVKLHPALLQAFINGGLRLPSTVDRVELAKELDVELPVAKRHAPTAKPMADVQSVPRPPVRRTARRPPGP